MLMAKGRSLTISRSHRLLENYSYGQSHSHGRRTVTNGSELAEDDLWSLINGDDYSETNETSLTSSRRRSSRDNDGDFSNDFDDSLGTYSGRILHQFCGQDDVAATARGRHVASSAPINVPDWSKIYRINSVDSLPDSGEGAEYKNSVMIPPHEYLARSRNSTVNSVFEGVGRTLKGRDMSRVRDGVWSQTGFYG